MGSILCSADNLNFQSYMWMASGCHQGVDGVFLSPKVFQRRVSCAVRSFMGKEEALIESAKSSLLKAVEYDAKKKPNDALRHYMQGIDQLDKAVKLMSLEDSRRTPLYKQIAQYVSRAEQLKDVTKIEVI
ncbi:unnamed protein product [Heligmosomoides polygyrus]|uniref:MIT domain-containing protein n=1 Tax=Heligmosomoides polygyrus TaxID=6339 RepID=A0A183GQM2_HELPZ|nr:unnamed protein product [Heligmosomoides polygyrus]